MARKVGFRIFTNPSVQTPASPVEIWEYDDGPLSANAFISQIGDGYGAFYYEMVAGVYLGNGDAYVKIIHKSGKPLGAFSINDIGLVELDGNDITANYSDLSSLFSVIGPHLWANALPA